MSKPYNSFAGQSPERLAALSDGIFAVGMTLLVLNLHLPSVVGGGLHGEQLVWQGNTFQSEQLLYCTTDAFAVSPLTE